MNRRLTWVYNALLIILIVSNFFMLSRLDAMEKGRDASRSEFRLHREWLQTMLQANETKHIAIMNEMEGLRLDLVSDQKRLGVLEKALPYQAMKDRGEQR